MKPEKEIFDFAMNQSGALLHESIMIGDNLDADIQGAMNAGMDNIFVNHIDATTDKKPSYIITHLKELHDQSLIHGFLFLQVFRYPLQLPQFHPRVFVEHLFLNAQACLCEHQQHKHDHEEQQCLLFV